jgi:hypothetical protein
MSEGDAEPISMTGVEEGETMFLETLHNILLKKTWYFIICSMVPGVAKAL